MPMNARLLRPIANNLDKDAAAYLNEVAIADGQQLEPAIKKAVNDFVKGCKQDGIWDSIKACCILMGARTLDGALKPLKGAAPTSNNFVSGDYNRETGLLGNASNKYIDTNRNNNADPQDSKHTAVYVTTLGATVKAYFGAGGGSNGATNFYNLTNNTTRFHTASSDAWGTATVGFSGLNRSESATYVGRSAGSNNTITRASQTPYNGNTFIFAQNGPGIGQPTDGRIAFYSIGESLTLSLFDTRVTALYNAIGAAI